MLRSTFPALLLLAACQSTPHDAGPPSAPADVQELIRQYVATTGYDVTYDEHTAELLSSLAITPIGPAGSNVLKVALSEASVPAATDPTEFHVIALQFAAAPELAVTLSGLVHAAAQGARTPKVKVLADARTNSLLVSAPPEQMQQLIDLAARLDREVTPGR